MADALRWQSTMIGRNPPDEELGDHTTTTGYGPRPWTSPDFASPPNTDRPGQCLRRQARVHQTRTECPPDPDRPGLVSIRSGQFRACYPVLGYLEVTNEKRMLHSGAILNKKGILISNELTAGRELTA